MNTSLTQMSILLETAMFNFSAGYQGIMILIESTYDRMPTTDGCSPQCPGLLNGQRTQRLPVLCRIIYMRYSQNIDTAGFEPVKVIQGY